MAEFSVYFLKVAALMVSIITRVFVILDTLDGTVTEILMTAALPLVITVRLLIKGKKTTDYTKTKKKKKNNNNNGRNNNNSNNEEKYQSIFREHINS